MQGTLLPPNNRKPCLLVCTHSLTIRETASKLYNGWYLTLPLSRGSTLFSLMSQINVLGVSPLQGHLSIYFGPVTCLMNLLPYHCPYVPYLHLSTLYLTIQWVITLNLFSQSTLYVQVLTKINFLVVLEDIFHSIHDFMRHLFFFLFCHQFFVHLYVLLRS